MRLGTETRTYMEREHRNWGNGAGTKKLEYNNKILKVSFF